MCARVVGPADGAKVGQPARHGHVANIAAAVEEGGAREQGDDQAQVQGVFGHLIHDPGAPRPPSRACKLGEVLFGQLPKRAARSRCGTHSIGALACAPSTAGMASNDRRPSRSSPQPWTRGWLARICSSSVVPERGIPTTNTAAAASPAPSPPSSRRTPHQTPPAGRQRAARCRQGRTPARPRPAPDSAVNAHSPRLQATCSAVVLTPRIEHVRQPEQQPGAGTRSQPVVGQPLLKRGVVGVRQRVAQQRRQQGMRLDRGPAATAAAAAERGLGRIHRAAPRLRVDSPHVEHRRGRTGNLERARRRLVMAAWPRPGDLPPAAPSPG